MEFITEAALALPGNMGFYLLEAGAWTCWAVMVYEVYQIYNIRNKKEC